MKVSEFFRDVKMLEKWMNDRNLSDMPIEVFDKRGELVDQFVFSVDIKRQVVEITD